jgi:hypothetical protein
MWLIVVDAGSDETVAALAVSARSHGVESVQFVVDEGAFHKSALAAPGDVDLRGGVEITARAVRCGPRDLQGGRRRAQEARQAASRDSHVACALPSAGPATGDAAALLHALRLRWRCGLRRMAELASVRISSRVGSSCSASSSPAERSSPLLLFARQNHVR